MTKLLTIEQERELIHRAQAGDDAAKGELIEKNLRLCWKNAHKCKHPGWIEKDDLVLEGVFGLNRAIELFDTSRNLKFSTYATIWIRQAIWRHLEKNYYPVKVPSWMFNRVAKVEKCNRKLIEKLDREPTPIEIATEMGISETAVVLALTIAKVPEQLDKFIGEEEDTLLSDMISTEENFEDSIDTTIMIQEGLDLLPERLRNVLELRFGLNGNTTNSLAAIGRMYGISREAVRIRQDTALHCLRSKLKDKDYLTVLEQSV